MKSENKYNLLKEILKAFAFKDGFANGIFSWTFLFVGLGFLIYIFNLLVGPF